MQECGRENIRRYVDLPGIFITDSRDSWRRLEASIIGYWRWGLKVDLRGSGDPKCTSFDTRPAKRHVVCTLLLVLFLFRVVVMVELVEVVLVEEVYMYNEVYSGDGG